jgi:hypothetical protein
MLRDKPLANRSSPAGRRTPIFGCPLAVGACLMAAGCRFGVAPMSLGVALGGKIEAVRDLCKKAAQTWQPPVKLGINSLFEKFKIGQMGAVRRMIYQQAGDTRKEAGTRQTESKVFSLSSRCETTDC